ncbi:acylneuraminate cytidylyltransferase family protein [Psychromonas sp. psych-6C06]|uniref:acylneuraminate cytidylyltransferase family protein n=1 Tax=Psychromonas sp. psych-6C06 TaxID=2058089 RepID=UPI000C34A74B|nr:acylneuraminate cytidylyltransferase family protein [Psychromonas sp. psych-6C06]PKF62897.1 acylneuraminate cytidylyltransferase family protein [Psychromonas sp. psych-6C06]
MLAIIPARGGSKGLPNKNIKLLNGKPLIAYTIEAALACSSITSVLVSTDDQAIYDVAINYGAQETFLRPQELATDTAMAIDNYIYTIERINREQNANIKEFVVLQPTSPLRNSEDIEQAIALFKKKQADSVISYCQEHHPISWHKYLNESGQLEDILPNNIDNRQALQPSYFPNGAIYVFSYKLIASRKYYSEKSYPFIMPRTRSVDIDSIDDFNYAAFLLEKLNA